MRLSPASRSRSPSPSASRAEASSSNNAAATTAPSQASDRVNEDAVVIHIDGVEIPHSEPAPEERVGALSRQIGPIRDFSEHAGILQIPPTEIEENMASLSSALSALQAAVETPDSGERKTAQPGAPLAALTPIQQHFNNRIDNLVEGIRRQDVPTEEWGNHLLAEVLPKLINGIIREAGPYREALVKALHERFQDLWLVTLGRPMNPLVKFAIENFFRSRTGIQDMLLNQVEFLVNKAGTMPAHTHAEFMGDLVSTTRVALHGDEAEFVLSSLYEGISERQPKLTAQLEALMFR